MAVDYWNSDTRKLVLDEDLYDEKTKTQLDKDGPHQMRKYMRPIMISLL